MSSFTKRYQHAIAQKELLPDPAQAEAVREFERISLALQKPQSWRERMGLKQISSVRGLYLWGGVGRGKTKLMDLFFEDIALDAKKRVHFHAFMRDIHLELAKRQGETDPLINIAKDLAKHVRLLCLDEFFVEDIGDAMILGRLLAALIDAGITLVITSNTKPNNLYANGLQRSQFLPAIALIEHHCVVHELIAGQDYRRRPLSAHELWLPCPTPLSADPILRQYWLHETGTAVGEIEWLTVNYRKLRAVAKSRDMVWFRFQDLCATPRSQQDYLVLAEQYHTLILSDIPIMAATENNAITYFIFLVDILYDAKVRLIVAAESDAISLYPSGRLIDTYQRTLSRLVEMQSEVYQQQL